MMRGLAGVVIGLIAWFLAATVVNRVLRLAWPGYTQAEVTLQFTLGMMVARLAMGAVSSVAGGAAAARLARGNSIALTALGIVLVGMFLPVHFSLWDRFPVWYHLTFLVSLLPLTLLGARLSAPAETTATVGAALRVPATR